MYICLFVCMYVRTYVCIFCFFRRSTAQTTQPILTHDSSKDAVWTKEVPSKKVYPSQNIHDQYLTNGMLKPSRDLIGYGESMLRFRNLYFHFFGVIFPWSHQKIADSVEIRAKTLMINNSQTVCFGHLDNGSLMGNRCSAFWIYKNIYPTVLPGGVIYKFCSRVYWFTKLFMTVYWNSGEVGPKRTEMWI